MGQRGFGRCFQRDEGGRSVEMAQISQRIKGTERKFEGHEEKHHGPESPLPRIRHTEVSAVEKL